MAPRTSAPRDWSIKDIRDLVHAKLGKRPCWFQIKIALALRAGRDVIGIAATGAGKTLSFWIPLVMALEEGQDKMVVVVTPLNLLGMQTETQLNNANLPCIAINKGNNKPSTYKDISAGKFRVITISPELLSEQPSRDVMENPKVASKFLYFVFDEAHCISQWGHSFRSQYLHVGNLRYLLPQDVPFFGASATLPPHILQDVSEILRLRPDKTDTIFCSNDRPNIHLVVRGIVYPIASYHDLAFLIPDGFHIGSPRFPKFLIFFDSTTCTEDAIKYLRTRLPPELRKKIIWFHSTMTTAYREEEFEHFRSDEVWGMAVTDAFGMGLDLPDVEVVVQYRLPGCLSTLWQRFGRSGRAANSEATAVLLVESTYLDDERLKKKTAAEVLSSAGLKQKSTKPAQPRRAPKRMALTTATNDAIPQLPAIAMPSTNMDAGVDETVNKESETPAPLPFFPERSDDARLLAYNKPESKLTTVSKKRTLELGSALDDFINAQHRGIKCRRHVPNLYFANRKALATLHLQCDKTDPQGCRRCAPKSTRLCCDLCNPDAFSNVAHVDVPRPVRAPNKSSISSYEATENDKKLHADLVTWRNERALEALGSTSFEEWGPEFFISDETLKTLVDCAHFNKLLTSEALQRETRWRSDYTKRFGSEILDIIGQYTTSGPKQRGPRLCSACGQPGHNRANLRCPRKVAGLSEASFAHPNSENINPAKSFPDIRPDLSIQSTSSHQAPHFITTPTPRRLYSPRVLSSGPSPFGQYATPERQLLPRPGSSPYHYLPSIPSSSTLPR